MVLIPFVIKSDGRSERGDNMHSRRLKGRIIFLVMARLLCLEDEAQEKDFYFYINSPGGSLTAGPGK
ncbi:MAG TPA: hypothetical protein ENO29_10200 [Candidatus Aminicenantes bacterium]|nr:MAG: hypothetical protein C0168_05785 [Candidatus Aminicenantes bacterium]HEK86706.1 hypothetical protein [Candidatus Aminicenantes bacterium]